MDFGGFLVGFVVPVVALAVAIWAASVARGRRGPVSSEERLTALEEDVRGLLDRISTLERGARPDEPHAVAPSTAAPAGPLPAPEFPPASAAPSAWGEAPATPLSPPTRAGMDLEQRIGARWATWVGVVVLLVGVALFLKWSFDNQLLGPLTRVALGLVAGLGALAAGLVLHRRRDVPFLSEGLAGLGLALLYLALYAAHGLYALLGAGAAFAAMCAVTVLGAFVSVVSSRQITAVLTVLGGLLTPVLLTVERPDERNLLAYLVVLDLLVLAVARFRTWPALNWLAWAGTALFVEGVLVQGLAAPHPLTRLVLLSILFAFFLAVPLIRERAASRRDREIDLLLVAANAAGYFWAVYVTLEPWQPWADWPWALGLAAVYGLVADNYASRVPEDEATVIVHEGIAWTFLTLSIPLALDSHWVTFAWAAQGVALLWAASRLLTPVAAWGGLAALIMAGARVVAVDRYWAPETAPVWNLAFLIHLLVVAALGWGGLLAGAARSPRLGAPRESLQSLLWLAAPLVLAVLLWREPPGLWPAVLLALELVLVGWLARASGAPGLVLATVALGGTVVGRVLVTDDLVARFATDTLVNRPLLVRVWACAALGLAGGALARTRQWPPAGALGRVLAGAAGVMLLFVLSVNWYRYQSAAVREAEAARDFVRAGDIRWVREVGLSVLWTLYAAAALGWGFLRAVPGVRYAALSLFGLTVLKVFFVDLGTVRTAYRILSFIVLGLVLLGVSLLYQKARRASPSA